MKCANHTLLLLVCLLLISGCASSQKTIADLQNLPQDSSKYFDFSEGNSFLLDPLKQQKKQFEYESHLFRPWQGDEVLPANIAFWALPYTQKEMYGENLQRVDSTFISHLVANMNRDSYPSMHHKGIITTNTSLRALPTHKPFFYEPTRAGEGYPFDMIQNSAIYVNTPVLITHRSQDGAWLHVQSSFAPGWVRSEEVAYVDDAFSKRFADAPLAMAIQDEFSVFDGENEFITQLPLGTVIPLSVNHGLVAVRQVDGQGMWKKIMIDSSQIAPMPLRVTRERLSHIASRLLGENYGWGGMYLNRDCSSMTRDLFAPFGIWLPRNSRAQKKAGKYISLKGLDLISKKKRIMKQGIPFGTLLYLPGHIMLYLGIKDHAPVAMHNAWGIRTKEWPGKEGRHIIGKAVITTLEPGIELDNIDREKGNLLQKIEGMVLLF